MANEIVKKLGMKSDIVFKAFFSREENKKFLEEFISAVLEEKIKVKNVVHDARLEQLAKREEGRQEGRKEGHKEKSLEIAKKMKSKNIPIEEIIELTGLTKEEMENLEED